MPKNSVGESFSVALFSVTEKVWIRGRGEVKIFRRKFFVSPCRKNSVGESFTVALNSCSEKVYGQEGEGSIKIFRRKFYCVTVPKNSVAESFTFALKSRIEKVWIRGGGEYQDFPLKFFCLIVLKD